MKKKNLNCPVFNEMHMDRCCGCEVCVQACPKQALTMSCDKQGFFYPTFEQEKCIRCKKCIKVCPMLTTIPCENAMEQYYGASHIETKVLLESASGGIFTFLYREFHKRFPDGYVVGAVYNDDFKGITHLISDTEADFERMRSSKYFQSRKNDIYCLTKSKLEEGRAVLFTGAPCEVAALYRFLDKDYKNLWTMDFICKGSSTPRMLSDYITYVETKVHSKAIYLNMRHKWENLDNWIPQFICIRFKNGKRLLKEFYNTELGLCFQILQRRSCQYCLFREKKHASDFTIGDLHGVTKKSKVFNHLGTSAIILNSEKSKVLWKAFDKTSLKVEPLLKEDIYGKNRNQVDPRMNKLSENLALHDGVTAVRKTVGFKEKIKMHMPVMLLRRITSWRRERRK